MPDLLLTPIVFLIAAVVLVPLAQRFKLGSVLAYRNDGKWMKEKCPLNSLMH